MILCLSLVSLISFLPLTEAGDVKLKFILHQNADVYEESIYGEPPQIAIWIEDPRNGATQTVYVTRKSGTGTFEGKTNVPVALPYWFQAYRKSTGRNDFPSPANPLPDAITGATTRGTILRELQIKKGSRWNYYIEVNVAGDFNENFPNYRSNGEMDPHGNGQPSLVYRGEIVAEPGRKSAPVLLGRTEQFFYSEKIYDKTDGITTAAQLLPFIEVACTTM